jgi:hypothetical protein
VGIPASNGALNAVIRGFGGKAEYIKRFANKIKSGEFILDNIPNYQKINKQPLWISLPLNRSGCLFLP